MDLIDRQVVLEKVRTMQTYKLSEGEDMLLVDKADVQTELMMLPSVQPEPCEDAISRQAARHALCKAVHKDEDIPCDNQTASCLWTGTRVCDYVREIDALPSVQPEPKEGHWIPHEGIDGDIQYECSECGVLWEFDDGTPEDNEAYYCPKCGADMRGEQHG